MVTASDRKCVGYNFAHLIMEKMILSTTVSNNGQISYSSVEKLIAKN